MKVLLLSFICILPAFSFANSCIDLSGVYSCFNGSQTQLVQIVKNNLSDTDDNVVYSFSPRVSFFKNILVDSQVHAFDTDFILSGYGQNETYTSTCNRDRLEINYSFDLLNWSQKYVEYKVTSKVNLFRSSNGTVTIQEKSKDDNLAKKTSKVSEFLTVCIKQ